MEAEPIKHTGVMHLSMLSPRGGPRANVGHLISIAFVTHGNLTKNLFPGWGCLLLLHGGMGPSHIIPCAHLCVSHLGNSVQLFLTEVKALVYTKSLVLTTHFQYKLMEHLTLWGLCGLLILNINSLFVRESSVGIIF